MAAYALGVDLGTTYTAAAIGRGSTATALQLGSESAAVPSVVVFRDDGDVIVGDAAERRSAGEPARSAREFKRRLGDPVPLIVADAPHSVEELMSLQLSDVIRQASEQEGEAPAVVVLTHPANYTDFKLGKLREVASLAGLDASTVMLLAEPEAAAITYTQSQRVETNEVIAVYDFGGGTFDAAVLRRSATGFELLGVPEGMERLGGIDFDQAVLAHVDGSLGGLVSSADRSDPQTLPAQARLRVDARRAKETLSTDADTSVPVALPGVNTEVRLTRVEFEAMVRPRIAQTVSALERTVASAGLTMADVSRILLVGGTSRMPVVAEIVGSSTGRPVSIDTHPKMAIATGAALAGAAAVATPATADPVAAEVWQAPTKVAPRSTEPNGAKRRSPALIFIAVATVGLVIAGAVLLLGGSDDADTVTDVDTTIGIAPDATQPDAAQPDTTVPVVQPPTDSQPASSAPPSSPSETTGPPSAGPVRVAELDADAVAMGLSLDGEVLVLTAMLQVVRVGADGSVAVLFDAVPDPGAVGGIAELPDGTIVATTSTGVISLDDGAVIFDGSTVGLGSTPGPIVADGAGSTYVSDQDNRRIIRRARDGSFSLVAGNGDDGSGSVPANGPPGTEVAIGPISGIGIDTSGRLLLVERPSGAVLAVAQDGTISTLATVVPGGLSGTATVDRTGAIWIGQAAFVDRVAPG